MSSLIRAELTWVDGELLRCIEVGVDDSGRISHVRQSDQNVGLDGNSFSLLRQPCASEVVQPCVQPVHVGCINSETARCRMPSVTDKQIVALL